VQELDDYIEIPDSAGLTEQNRAAILNLWDADPVPDQENRLHYTRVPPLPSLPSSSSIVANLGVCRTATANSTNSAT
jgi:hypothetical protein